jgi:hypothetical protein
MIGVIRWAFRRNQTVMVVLFWNEYKILKLRSNPRASIQDIHRAYAKKPVIRDWISFI